MSCRIVEESWKEHGNEEGKRGGGEAQGSKSSWKEQEEEEPR